MQWQWPAIMTAACVAATLHATPTHRATVPDRNVGCLAVTEQGDVQGSDLGASCAFLGIPFAAPPTGENRWRPPQPAQQRSALLNVITQPAPCAQMPPTNIPAVEDCLKLNVWAPNPAPETPAPVVVWFHTGGFVAASNNFAGTNGRKLAEETGVIVVEPNYRLGPFGFLAQRAFLDEDPAHPSSGNYGLMDQQAALQWVRDNIANFGGDPENVTIGGTSAGGHSTGLHLVMPGSAGLFVGAIVESAYPTSRTPTNEEALAQGDLFATRLGCTDPLTLAACLRAQPMNLVLNALALFSQQAAEPPNRFNWGPSVDGIVIPNQPRTLLEQGQFHHVPVIIGTNRDEGWGNFIIRSFPTGVTLAQYEGWVNTEFGDDAQAVLQQYPAANFASPQEAMARVIGDGQFVCEARRLADLIADGGLRGRGPHEDQGIGQRVKMPVFLYSYEYELDDLSLDHVIHGVETNIIFGNNYTPGQFPNHPLTAADLALHNIMAGYWTRFMGTGDPNTADLQEWPVYEKNHESRMIFDGDTNAAVAHKDESCAFWTNFFFRSLLTDLPAAAH